MSFSFGIVEWYLLGINILGLLLFLLNTWLYTHTETGQIDVVLTILSLAGASFGIILGILIVRQKPVKPIMMSRVFVICVFIIELIAYLVYKGYINDTFNYNFLGFFQSHQVLCLYLIVINVVSIVLFGVDKIRSLDQSKHKPMRIRIVTLLGIALAGGSVGALIGMYAFRHKTKKDYFTIGVPLILIMQLIVVIYLMNTNISLNI